MELYTTPDSRVRLEDLIRSRELSPSIVLANHIKNLSSDTIITISIALREGADPNMYVDTGHPMGPMHILVYLFMQNNSEHQDFVSSVLYYSGADTDKRAFRSYNESVRLWLSNNGIEYNRYNDLAAVMVGKNIANNLDPVERTITIIRSHANDHTAFNLIFTDGYDMLLECIKYYNSNAAIQYIESGYNLSYPVVNVLLLNLSINQSVTDRLMRVLVASIRWGLSMDTEQINMIKDPQIYNQVVTEYNRPRWQKNKNKIMGYDIRLLLGDDHAHLMKQLAYRQMARTGSKFGTPDEFTEHTPPILSVVNLLNAYDYVDESVVFYRDPETMKTYGWTSDQFDSILQSKTNPETGKRLPNNILSEMSDKNEIMKRMSTTPLTWDQLSIMASDNDQFDTSVDVQPSSMNVNPDYQLSKLTNRHARITANHINQHYPVAIDDPTVIKL